MDHLADRKAVGAELRSMNYRMGHFLVVDWCSFARRIGCTTRVVVLAANY